MKKSLIALAIASAVSAPAFAATANVDVYGKFNLVFGVFNDQSGAINDNQVSSMGSRIGFKGTEDLGGGLAAVWQIETGFDADEQTVDRGEIGNRNTFVGLKSGLGTVIIGKHDTPYKSIGRSVDLFGDTYGDSRNLFAAAASETRPSNMVMYNSPTFSGMTVSAQYVTANSNGTGGDPEGSDGYSASLAYTGGPFYLGAAYGTSEGAGGDRNSDYRLAAGLSLGSFKLVGQYDLVDRANTFTNVDTWMLGASFGMGNLVFKGNYIAQDAAGGLNVDGEQFNVGADYNLSKRTTVFAMYTAGENVTLGAGAGGSDRIGAAGGLGDEVNAFSLGVSHSF